MDATPKRRVRVYPATTVQLGGAHEAAERYDRALASWQPPVRAANGDVLPDKPMVDSRALDALRNDAFVTGGAQLHRDSIVGSMFTLNAKPRTGVLGLDEAWESEFQEEVEQKFALWAESPECWPDASRHNTLTGLVRLAISSYVAHGEALATAEWIRSGARPYRTAIQLIDPQRLSTPYDRPYDYRNNRGGVRVNAYGAPVGYWIRRALPLEHLYSAEDSYRWSYVRARGMMGRPQVIHILEQGRPGQSRGISQLVTALKETRMLKRFRDVTLQAAVLQASYVASIVSELPSDVVFQQLGAGDIGNNIVDYAEKMLGAVEAYGESARNMGVDGVKIPHLFPGTKLEMNNVGAPEGVGEDFEGSMLRYIASALNVSFEQLSKDYRETNYSSARAGMLETWKFMRARKKVVADRFASVVYRLWFEEAVNMGALETMMGSAPNMYEDMNMAAYTSADWIGAGHGQIDEQKETAAAAERIATGISTLEDEAARLGKDWRMVLSQRAREVKVLDELGITIAGMNGASPMEQMAAAAGDPEADEEVMEDQDMERTADGQG